ncbi:MAG: hypothetical protein II024_03040 [Firmicutes bacterium]|nr:hypothetical protein [Bacillota bacterium]
MAENSNVSQLTGGTPTAGELQPGKLTQKDELQPGTITGKKEVVGGLLYTPTYYGVRSVNGKMGEVTLDAADVGAASTEDFESHVQNTTVHITENERAAWNQCLIGAVNAEESLTFWHAEDVI